MTTNASETRQPTCPGYHVILKLPENSQELGRATDLAEHSPSVFTVDFARGLGKALLLKLMYDGYQDNGALTPWDMHFDSGTTVSTT